MSRERATRRNVLKTIGAAGAVGVLSVTNASAASTADYPVVYISQNVYNNYSRYDVMKPASSLLLDALPYDVASQASLETEYPNVSTASSLSEAHSQFKSFLDTADYPSNETNVLIVDETKFDSARYEADAFGGEATTVAGAKHFEEYHKQNGVPGQYGDSEAYDRFWSMLVGVGLNYGCSYGQGVTYYDPSITSQWDYVRTPMVVYGDSENTKTTNECGDTTWRNNYIATKELRYSDCSLSTIKANGTD